MGLNDKDRGLLARFGMTEGQVERDAAMAESETEPDDLNGRVHYGPRLDKPDEETAGAGHPPARIHGGRARQHGQTPPRRPQRITLHTRRPAVVCAPSPVVSRRIIKSETTTERGGAWRDANANHTAGNPDGGRYACACPTGNTR